MDASRCAGTLSKRTAEAAAEAAGSGGIKGEPGMGTEGKAERLPTSRRRVEERDAAARLRANGSTGGGGTSAGAQRWADTRLEVPKPEGATASTQRAASGFLVGRHQLIYRLWGLLIGTIGAV